MKRRNSLRLIPMPAIDILTNLEHVHLAKGANTKEMCKFAHGLLEARCAKCKVIGEHWADECPKRRNM